MKKGRFLLRWAAVAALLAAFSLSGIEAMGGAKQPAAGEPRADHIVIDSLSAYGKLEEKAVGFSHDRHTKALQEQGKDCSTCHETEKDRLSTRFKGIKDQGKAAVKEIYHAGCIGCHRDTAAAGKDSGPTDVSCRSCHDGGGEPSSWRAIRLGKSLHYRHIASGLIPKNGQEDNCAACHHKYDEAAKKIVPAKGEEESCGYCHTDKPQGDVKDLRTASHTACVSCHVNIAAQGAKAGPATCEGCHTEAAQAKFEVVKDVPRLKRGQPDAAFLAVADAKALDRESKAMMRPVAFDHKLHEQAVENCSDCHHKAMKSCAQECHTQDGAEKGGFVTLEQAMHAPDAPQSCVGCHARRTAAKDCAGCHTQMPKAPEAKESCAVCHTDGGTPVDTTMLKTMSKDDKSAMAAAMLQAEKAAPGLPALDEIPEKVAIADLADRYEPAEFPHRKIVESMYAKVKTSKLASAFHTSKATFCQGCHHNSPASATPPRCASCHGRTRDAAAGDRPGLKAAYHQQCIGCHTAMGLEKPAATACADCHKERKK
ncbi:sulfate respiration complex hexadecaheme cytochrome HmcA [Desulfocurvus sp. DL9XJH121]